MLRGLKWLAARVIRFSLRYPVPNLSVTLAGGRRGCLAAVALGARLPAAVRRRGRAAQRAPAAGHVAGDVQRSCRHGRAAACRKSTGVESIRRRTGRAELDEHVIGVNMTEFIVSFDPQVGRSREEVLDDIREAMADIPGIVTSVEQPLAHLISPMLSGVQAQVAIKLYGDDLDVLRGQGRGDEDGRQPGAGREGPDGRTANHDPAASHRTGPRPACARYGLTPDDVNEFIETAMHGKVVSEVLAGTADVRSVRAARRRLPREPRSPAAGCRSICPTAARRRSQSVATIYEAGGPNTINREQVRRRIVLQCNTAGRGLVDVVQRHPSAAQADRRRRCRPATSSSTAGSSRASSRPRG